MSKDFENLLLDKLEQAIIEARESVAPSISVVMLDLMRVVKQNGEDIQSLKEDISEIKESVKPVVSAINTANSLRSGMMWLSGFILAFTGVALAIKEFLRK